MEMADFPGQKKNIADAPMQRNSSRQPYVYDPTCSMSLKGRRAP